jgi:hypothetical protein
MSYKTDGDCTSDGNIILKLSDYQSLREELEALKADNAKLNSVVCQTCHGAGSVCSAPDDCYNCPACTATYNKIRVDAIRDAKEATRTANTDIGQAWLCRVVDLEEYANKIEAE